MKRLNKKGFTLAELLIVVAIIAVLVAIAIPIFTSQLEKAREATDAANIRAAYAEVQTAVLTGEDTGKAKIKDGSATETITLKQQTDGWQNSFEFPANLTEGSEKLKAGQEVEITATESGASINIKLTK
ncbi:MAG: prepilin-type N-terminal cleavage/methylation domain-containing protein [Lachnospiraceae bacterium]|nr:prepilin-type N-terminal cleavage/methylation domain-containing protein [Lachnospiraceae bacterium]